MRTLLLLFLSTFLVAANAQKNPTQKAQPIVKEGKKLYLSEMASWYGTDIFLEAYENRENIGGYFSYTDEGTSRCIFYSTDEKPQVIGTISFDSTFSILTASTDLKPRSFTETENDLYTIRTKALELVNTDTLFKSYSNTNLNLIPLITKKEKKVYIITGPQKNGVVIFGNDYLITFNKKNKVTEKKQLHRNIIPINYSTEENDTTKAVTTMHSHTPETGDYITATDICTLMLYSKFSGWESHNVVSKEYLNIWDCEKEKLTVIPMKTIDKINGNEEKSEEKGKAKK
ncbi:hypothetical protein [Owenweeksia hongkongensis]|uniref:hypothetical protein n=1 Tax=Owenweeksia hongkongensis TaxID=253245 RepID=UPI003A929A4A